MALFNFLKKKKTLPPATSLQTYNPSTGTLTTYGAGGTSSSQSVSTGAMTFGSAGGGTNPATVSGTPSKNYGGSGGGSGGVGSGGGGTTSSVLPSTLTQTSTSNKAGLEVNKALSQQQKAQIIKQQGVSSRQAPYLTQMQTGSFKADGRTVPVKDVFYVEGKTSRNATPEEKEYYYKQAKELTIPEKERGFNKLQSKINVASTKAERKKTFVGNVEATGLGFASSVVSTGQFAQSLVTKPIQTIKSSVQSIPQIPSRLGELGATIRQRPSFALGFTAGEVAQFKAPSIITKGSDIVRVRGAKAISSEKIIAEEFFKGQKYPQIAKGETAGQLLKEFKPMKELGEIKPAGFTASPTSFKKSTITQAGSSEVAGLYQSPKLSPAFLKVSSEGKAFSFKILPNLKPTAIRTTPLGFKLAEGVKRSQRGLTKVSTAKSFFDTQAQKGYSYVPFLKTEKESIITAGTPIKRVGKPVYFEFEGRKVPVYTYEVVETPSIKQGKVGNIKIETVGSVSKRYSYGRSSGNIGVINPLSSTYSLKYGSYSTPSSISSLKYSPTSSLSSVISSSKYVSPSKSISKSPSVSYISSFSKYVSPSKSTSKSYFPSRVSSFAVSKSKITAPYKGFGGYANNKYSSPLLTNKGYTVSIRRRGKFFTIGKGLSLGKAFEVGTQKIRTGIGATFKVTSPSGGIVTAQTPKGFYQKKGGLFIEQSKYRLNTGGELKEIKIK